MSFSNGKSRPNTHFDEGEDVRYRDMAMVVSPPKKRFSLSSRTPSSRASKATPYPTPLSRQTAGRLFPSGLSKQEAPRATPKSGLALPSRPAGLGDPDHQLPQGPFESAAAGVPDADSEKRVCSRPACHKELPVYGRYKTCDRCRQKSREQQRRQKAVKDATTREVLKRPRYSSPSKNEEELEMTRDWSHLSTAERFQNFMSQLRARGKLTVKGPHALDTDASEYRTSKDLYNDLTRVFLAVQPDRHSGTAAIVKPVDFRGHFQVVRDNASPLSRESVLSEVRVAERTASLRLRKDIQPILGKFRTPNNQFGYVAEYRCGCGEGERSCGGTVTVKVTKVQKGVVHGEKVAFRIKHP